MRILFFLCITLALFADVKEVEYSIPFQVTFNAKGETAAVAGAMIQLTSGEVLWAWQEGDTFALENPFDLVQDEEDDDEYIFTSLIDGAKLGDGIQIAWISGKKIERTVVYVDEECAIFDDGYEVKRQVDVELPYHISFESSDVKFSMDLYSLFPPIVSGEVDFGAFGGAQVQIDCTKGVSMTVQAQNEQGDIGSGEFLADEELTTALGLGQYKVGERYTFYPVSGLEALFGQDFVLDLTDFYLIRKMQ